jgi:hypothetical protein
MAQAAGYRTPRFLTFKQALELGGNVRKGEHGTKVYFVKQLQVRDEGADDSPSGLVRVIMRNSVPGKFPATRRGNHRTCVGAGNRAFRVERSQHSAQTARENCGVKKSRRDPGEKIPHPKFFPFVKKKPLNSIEAGE